MFQTNSFYDTQMCSSLILEYTCRYSIIDFSHGVHLAIPLAYVNACIIVGIIEYTGRDAIPTTQ